MISLTFQVETEYGVYSDAIVLPDNHNLTDENIEDLKQQRVANWITVITTPTLEEPTVEGL